MAGWKEYSDNVMKLNKEKVAHLEQVVKYAKHSKKRHIAERELKWWSEWLQQIEDIRTLPYEEFITKYPDFEEPNISRVL